MVFIDVTIVSEKYIVNILQKISLAYKIIAYKIWGCVNNDRIL